MANNIYIGNRYVPVFANPVEWDNLREYEPLTIVTYQGTSYTSKKTVPVGTGLDNKDYWVVTGNYNQQVEAYRQETIEIKELANNTKSDLDVFKNEQNNTNTELDGKISDLNTSTSTQIELITSSLDTLKDVVFDGDTPNIIYVAKSGGRFHTITEAINFAKGYCTRTNRVTILIGAGVYNESIVLTKNPGIDLVGIGMPEIVNNAVYPNGPANIYGDTYIEGIYFHSTSTNAYAFHLDGGSDTNYGTTVKVVNCKFVSEHAPGLGCGCTRGCNYTFINCDFYGTEGIYVHNEASSNVAEQHFNAIGCKINGSNYAVNIDDAPKVNFGTTGSPLVLNFAGSYSPKVRNMINFRATSSTTFGYIPGDSNGIMLSLESCTQMLMLDYKYMGGYKITLTIPTYSNVGEIYIPVENANWFNWTVTTSAPGVGTYGASVTATHEHWLTIKKDSGNWSGNTIQVDLLGTA